MTSRMTAFEQQRISDEKIQRDKRREEYLRRWYAMQQHNREVRAGKA